MLELTGCSFSPQAAAVSWERFNAGARKTEQLGIAMENAFPAAAATGTMNVAKTMPSDLCRGGPTEHANGMVTVSTD
jgi:hypothetical protein